MNVFLSNYLAFLFIVAIDFVVWKEEHENLRTVHVSMQDKHVTYLFAQASGVSFTLIVDIAAVNWLPT